MKRQLQRLAIGALFAASVGMADQAHATFSVVLDCYGTGGNPDWSQSNNKITVTALMTNGVLLNLGSVVPRYQYCRSEGSAPFFVNGDYLATQVQWIHVTTNGKDNFWIDRVQLWDGSWFHRSTGAILTLVTQWGINNNVGYCISKQASDGYDNPFCFETVATPSRTFYR